MRDNATQFALLNRCPACGGAMSIAPGSVHYCDQFPAFDRNKSLFPPTLGDALADALAPDSDLLSGKLEEVQMTKAQYLEQMAAAFIVQTGIPATECVLVQEQLPHPQYGWRFYFERRKA